ncbi:hypothetical protein BIV60_04885 [Bacillus sp. MUM 116]|uniref:stalk domain-containing protein n=1 Tax=Bacillus sp. MUM 116 TaxID=1678002 RepID=UPI0008F57A85|nr:stalk domain-containing protein [Bacillus sp. MUM 116]OIK16351.1 hypothetical protein BIV60_04885 [Bacillus sp. MUM 116]
MKKQLSSIVIASAVLAGSTFTPIALHSVQAASIQQKQTVFKEKLIVNGQFKEVQFTVKNKVKLYSSQDLSKLIAASFSFSSKTKTYTITKTQGKQKFTQKLQAGSTNAVVNGKKVKLAAAPKLIGKTLFVDMKPFIKALGGDSLVDKSLLISTNGTLKFGSAKLNIDGQSKAIKTFTMGRKQLFSAEDIAKLFSASVKENKNKLYVSRSGKVVQIDGNPIKVKGKVYADLNQLVKALGGDILTNQNGQFISTGLISGDTSNPQWIDNSTLLVTNENSDSDVASYIVNIHSKKSSIKINSSEVTVSPNGKQAIYSDESGFVYLVDLQTNKVTTLNNTDDAPKLGFVWSKDGGTVYCISGDKSNNIDAIKISDGSITSVYSDSLNAKSDLKISQDGKKLIYTVGKEGTTVYTDDDKTDVSDIDLTGTESQLYVVNLSNAEVQATALTSTPDNKLFSTFMKNGNIIYTSYTTDDDTLPVLNMINSQNIITPLVTNKDILSTVVTVQGKVLFIAEEDNGYRSIYEVNPNTRKLTRIVQTKLNISALSVSPDGISIAVSVSGDHGDRTMILKNGQFEILTK